MLNEPDTSLPEAELAPKYQALLVDVIDADEVEITLSEPMVAEIPGADTDEESDDD